VLILLEEIKNHDFCDFFHLSKSEQKERQKREDKKSKRKGKQRI
jgi:hypothetical protein